MKKMKQIAIRMDEDLYNALVADAIANGRTVAQSVRFLLKKELKNDHA